MNRKGRNSKKGYKKSNLSDQLDRQLCDCEAREHPLVNNCLSCGKIVCLKEGPGPCFFCGAEVAYPHEPLPTSLNLTNSNTPADPAKAKAKDATASSGKSNNQPPPAQTPMSLAPLELRNKLLEYDKNSAVRTSVIDDECDYYDASGNKWLTKDQRERLGKLEEEERRRKHKSRLEQRLTMDLTGRVEREEEDLVELYERMNCIQDERNFNRGGAGAGGAGGGGGREVYGEARGEEFRGPVYVGDGSLPSNPPNPAASLHNRIQDKSLQEISDQGVCLSMHQPYASLLVRGIKTTEGRTWYSAHRGRLWIASTAKEPNSEEVANVEATYRALSDDQDLDFPKTYPTGCLLGCVTVTDVLSQEEYDAAYPDNHVNSPYVFLCESPFELPMKYPLQGKHKIYKLEPVIHRAAMNCLEKTCARLAKCVKG